MADTAVFGLNLDFTGLDRGARQSETILDRLEKKLDNLTTFTGRVSRALKLDGAKDGETALTAVERRTASAANSSQKLTREVDGVGAAYKRASSAAQSSTSGLTGGLNSIINLAGKASSGITSIASTALGVFGGNLITSGISAIGNGLTATIQKGIQFNDTMAKSRIQLRTLLGRNADVEGFIGQLQKISDESEFQFPDVLKWAAQLKTARFEAGQLAPTIRIVGDAVAYLGGGTDATDRILLALRQIKNESRVTAENLNQLLDANVPVFDIIEKKTGLRPDQFRKLAERNQVNANEFVRLLLSGLDEAFKGGQQQIADSTVGVLFDTLDDTFARRAGDATKNLTATVRTSLSGAIQALNSDQGKALAGSIDSASGTVLGPINALLKGALTGNFTEEAKAVGANITAGIAAGVAAHSDDLDRAVYNAAAGVITKAKDVLGIKSPSTEFADIGRNANLGLALGISENTSLAEDAISALIDRTLEAGKKKFRVGANTSALFGQVEQASGFTESEQDRLKKLLAARQDVFDKRGGSVGDAGLLSGNDALDRAIQIAADNKNLNARLLQVLSFYESAFRVDATSPTGPRGPFQFTLGTGRGEGLNINVPGRRGYDPSKPVVDERLDPDKSAAAAASHISDLIRQFKSVDLALAAYNQGPGAVRAAGNQVPNITEAQNYVRDINLLLRFLNSVAESADASAIARAGTNAKKVGTLNLGNLGAVSAGPSNSDLERALNSQFGQSGGRTIQGGEVVSDITARIFEPVELNLTKLSTTLDTSKLQRGVEALAALNREIAGTGEVATTSAEEQRKNRAALRSNPNADADYYKENFKNAFRSSLTQVLSDPTTIKSAVTNLLQGISQAVAARASDKITNAIFDRYVDPLIDKILGGGKSGSSGNGSSGGIVDKIAGTFGGRTDVRTPPFVPSGTATTSGQPRTITERIADRVTDFITGGKKKKTGDAVIDAVTGKGDATQAQLLERVTQINTGLARTNQILQDIAAAQRDAAACCRAGEERAAQGTQGPSLLGTILGTFLGNVAGGVAGRLKLGLPKTGLKIIGEDGSEVGGNVKARAGGGPVTAGQTYLVGERGPELFNAPASGYITPNSQLRQAGSAANTFNTTVNVTVQGGNNQPLDRRSKDQIMREVASGLDRAARRNG